MLLKYKFNSESYSTICTLQLASIIYILYVLLNIFLVIYCDLIHNHIIQFPTNISIENSAYSDFFCLNLNKLKKKNIKSNLFIDIKLLVFVCVLFLNFEPRQEERITRI